MQHRQRWRGRTDGREPSGTKKEKKVLKKSFQCVLGHGDFLKKIKVSSHDEGIQEVCVCVCVCVCLSPSRKHTEERCHLFFLLFTLNLTYLQSEWKLT